VSFDKAGLMGDASILDEFGVPTVLTTWLNYDGYGFNAPYQNLDLNGYSAYWMHKHLYLIHTGFDEKNLKKLIEFFDETPTFNPENIVLFGYSFIEWSVTEMLEKNLKVLNDSEKKLKINVDVRY
jgi:type III restriction enzyme/adenine-specific DNA-methyltransferase